MQSTAVGHKRLAAVVLPLIQYLQNRNTNKGMQYRQREVQNYTALR